MVDETDKRIFLGSCTGTMDALGEGASGKLKPPLGAQSPSSVGSLGKAGLGQLPPIIALGLKTNYIRPRGWCMIVHILQHSQYGIMNSTRHPRRIYVYIYIDQTNPFEFFLLQPFIHRRITLLPRANKADFSLPP